MSRACNDTEEPRGERTVVSDMVRMLAEEFGSQSHQIVESAGSLQRGRGGDDAHDDEHHVERDIAGLESEDEDENEYAYHTVDTETDTSHAGTDENQCQYNEKLNNN